MMAKDILIKVDDMTPENKCSFCTNSTCCSYFTQQIDTPTKKYDFDHMLWQISHRDVQFYKDDDGWFLLINNKCTHLGERGVCAIYEDRPQVCRDYDNEWCEYDSSAEEGFELFFEDYDSLLSYCKKFFKNWDKRKDKTAKKKKKAKKVKKDKKSKKKNKD